MPANFSSKRIADAQTFAAWHAVPDADFKGLGLTRDQLKQAQASLSGNIIFKGDPTYDQARQIFNPMFNAYPGVIVKCQTEADVGIALALARQMPLGFCLRSGGHSTAGYSTTNGMLIDVSALNQIVYDPSGTQITVGTGVNFGQLFQDLDAKGLNVPGGECPDVCVGGFVQGGGYGFTSGMYGLNCDNAVGFRVMLADGTIIRADAQTNPDLFWALRGGTGGNFGILLSVDLKVRPVGQMTGFAYAWPLTSAAGISNAAAAMAVLQAGFSGQGATDTHMTVQTSLCFQNHIDPMQPPPPAGTPLSPYFMIRGMSDQDPGTVAQTFAAIAAMPGCITQWIAQGSFRSLNDKLLNYPQGMPVLDQMPFEDKSSSYIARNLSAQEWENLFALFASAPNNMAYGYGELYSGAITSVGTYDTAFIHREVSLNMVMDVYWLLNADRETCETFLADWNAAVAPLSNGESYQNYPSAADPAFIERFWGAAYPVLQAVKAKYDPDNAFAFPQQIWADPTKAPVKDPGVPPGVIAALQRPVTVTLH
ncbi:FAD-binding oxidoreductase [Loktanella sp. 3ANDIMAR09]|uniref:FAD-binding oxidoreductase n=1 Tax=Loktanella sp. 3ANDIMAR09 TaxID=1225657 RepID=UPI0007019966|nr:FAD-binding oxidoreductase [Loktanella sp. 3ANDIMAR09]